MLGLDSCKQPLNAASAASSRTCSLLAQTMSQLSDAQLQLVSLTFNKSEEKTESATSADFDRMLTNGDCLLRLLHCNPVSLDLTRCQSFNI